MIDRYTLPEMKKLTESYAKFVNWLIVERAVLQARMEAGEITSGEYAAITTYSRFTVERIEELDEGPQGFGHDMLAFVETCKENMCLSGVSESTIQRFHESVTSYDIEDNAFSMMLREAISLIRPKIAAVEEALIQRAKEYKNTLLMGITHIQPAEVITLAVRLLNWADIFSRDLNRLDSTKEEISVGRLAGMVGVFGDLSPKIEARVCEILKLKPVRISTQIIHRDRYAHLMSVLEILAGNIQHVALTLWLMVGAGEAREPFRKTQRGSSRAPHKKNPVGLERLKGLPAMIRGYAHAVMELIPTPHERDISQSGVERIAYADALTLVHFMLNSLERIVKGIEFFPDKMLQNIEATLGQNGSGYVKNLLIKKGVTELLFEGQPLGIYDWVQKCSFKAWDKRQHLKECMIEEGVLDFVSQQEIETCFDYRYHTRFVGEIYERFGI